MRKFNTEGPVVAEDHCCIRRFSGWTAAPIGTSQRNVCALPLLRNPSNSEPELHWYEAHGIGRRELKRKRYLDRQ